MSPMNHYSHIARNSSSSLKKPNRPSFVSGNGDCTFIWSNLAFIPDENNDHHDQCSSVGSNILLTSPDDDECNKKRKLHYFNMHVTEEELKIREELVREIERELEREIMDGILVLVHRLSDLKAKQIAKGLKKNGSMLMADAISREFSA